jgi:hypothetical protein
MAYDVCVSLAITIVEDVGACYVNVNKCHWLNSQTYI